MWLKTRDLDIRFKLNQLKFLTSEEYLSGRKFLLKTIDRETKYKLCTTRLAIRYDRGPYSLVLYRLTCLRLSILALILIRDSLLPRTLIELSLLCRIVDRCALSDATGLPSCLSSRLGCCSFTLFNPTLRLIGGNFPRSVVFRVTLIRLGPEVRFDLRAEVREGLISPLFYSLAAADLYAHLVTDFDLCQLNTENIIF